MSELHYLHSLSSSVSRTLELSSSAYKTKIGKPGIDAEKATDNFLNQVNDILTAYNKTAPGAAEDLISLSKVDPNSINNLEETISRISAETLDMSKDLSRRDVDIPNDYHTAGSIVAGTISLYLAYRAAKIVYKPINNFWKILKKVGGEMEYCWNYIKPPSK